MREIKYTHPGVIGIICARLAALVAGSTWREPLHHRPALPHVQLEPRAVQSQLHACLRLDRQLAPELRLVRVGIGALERHVKRVVRGGADYVRPSPGARRGPVSVRGRGRRVLLHLAEVEAGASDETMGPAWARLVHPICEKLPRIVASSALHGRAGILRLNTVDD